MDDTELLRFDVKAGDLATTMINRTDVQFERMTNEPHLRSSFDIGIYLINYILQRETEYIDDIPVFVGMFIH